MYLITVTGSTYNLYVLQCALATVHDLCVLAMVYGLCHALRHSVNEEAVVDLGIHMIMRDSLEQKHEN